MQENSECALCRGKSSPRSKGKPLHKCRYKPRHFFRFVAFSATPSCGECPATPPHRKNKRVLYKQNTCTKLAVIGIKSKMCRSYRLLFFVLGIIFIIFIFVFARTNYSQHVIKKLQIVMHAVTVTFAIVCKIFRQCPAICIFIG